MSKITISLLVGALASIASIPRVNAHGKISGIIANGQWYEGIGFYFHNPPPTAVGWSTDDWDLGFVTSGNYSNPDIICHRSATPDNHTIEVAAGSTVELQWTPWPSGHHGPVLDYLASCNGDCETVDKTALEFFKISEGGLIDGSSSPGTWASDQLIANNNSWTVTVPSSIAPGNYVLRHEIIALQFADVVDNAQNYPQCINLKITGSGTETPPGISATKFYTAQDPGVLFSLWKPLTNGYIIPGPAMFDGSSPAAGNSSNSPVSSNSSSPVSSAGSSSSVSSSYTSPMATSAGSSSSVSPSSYTSSMATSAATASVSPTTTMSSVATSVSSGKTASGGAFYTVSSASSSSSYAIASTSSIVSKYAADTTSTGGGYADPTYTDISHSPSPTSLTAPTTTAAALESVLAVMTSTVPTAIMTSAAPTVTASYADGTKTFSTDDMSVADLFTLLKQIYAALRTALGGEGALVSGHWKAAAAAVKRERKHARDLFSG